MCLSGASNNVVPSSRIVAASAFCVAIESIVVQRLRKSVCVANWLWSASCRALSVAAASIIDFNSLFIRPPVSMAATASRSGPSLVNSGYWRCFLRFSTAANVEPALRVAFGCGCPFVFSGEMRVTSIAMGLP